MKKKIKVSKAVAGLAIVSVVLQALDLYKYEQDLKLKKELRKEAANARAINDACGKMREEFVKELQKKGINYYSYSMTKIRHAFGRAEDNVLFPGLWDEIDEKNSQEKEAKND